MPTCACTQDTVADALVRRAVVPESQSSCSGSVVDVQDSDHEIGEDRWCGRIQQRRSWMTKAYGQKASEVVADESPETKPPHLERLRDGGGGNCRSCP